MGSVFSTKRRASKAGTLRTTKTSKSTKSTRRADSDDDLNEEDLQIVTVPMNGHGSKKADRRLSAAKDLVASGRPVSIHLDAVPDNGKDATPTWDNEEDRLRWKDQLRLMRTFYDWEEIPLDFFVDTYVGGEKHRRLSLSIQAVDTHATLNQNQHPNSQKLPVAPKPLPAPPLPSRSNRSASVAVPSQNIIQKPVVKVDVISELPVAKAEEAPSRPPPPLPPRRVRAASVAIGEPIKEVVVVPKKNDATPSLDELKSMPSSHSTNRSKKISEMINEESRPRRASATSIDEVYGRLGKQSKNDRFETENPLISGKVPERRPTIDKRPEQFERLSHTIDPSTFVAERKNTRKTSPTRPSIVDIPVKTIHRGSSDSTHLESKLSDEIKIPAIDDPTEYMEVVDDDEAPRLRGMSDWL